MYRCSVHKSRLWLDSISFTPLQTRFNPTRPPAISSMTRPNLTSYHRVRCLSPFKWTNQICRKILYTAKTKQSQLLLIKLTVVESSPIINISFQFSMNGHIYYYQRAINFYTPIFKITFAKTSHLIDGRVYFITLVSSHLYKFLILKIIFLK